MAEAYCFPRSNQIIGNNGEILLSTILQGAVFLAVARCLHLLLGNLRQPRIVSQLLTGIILGPALWSPDGGVSKFLFPKDTGRNLTVVGHAGRMLYIFLLGLEADIPYLWRTKRAAAEIAAGSVFVCAITAAALTHVFVKFIENRSADPFKIWLYLVAILANTASPVVIDLCGDMGLATSETGRLAVASAIFNDIACFGILTIASSSIGLPGMSYFTFFAGIPIFIVLLFGFRASIRLLNHFHRPNTDVNMMETLWIMAYLVIGASFAYQMGLSPIISSFVMGILFPRDEKIRRSLVQQLMGIVHIVVFPVYFGYTGLQLNFSILGESNGLVLVLALILLSSLCKVLGTLAVITYRKVPLSDGFLMGLLLNTKGHFHVMIASLAMEAGFWGIGTQRAVLIMMVVCTVISGSAASFIRRGRSLQAINHVGMERTPPESELKMILCVYAVRHVPAMMNLIAASSGAEGATLTAHVIHLIELTRRNTTSLLYHQRPEEDADDLGDGDAREIINAINIFSDDERLKVLSLKICSEFENMHMDLCQGAEEMSASIIILPFHKHRRVDGRMEVTEDGYRTANQRIKKHAHCTVAVLVDRGLGDMRRSSCGEDVTYEIAVLFFGGADDREALAYAGRIAEHPAVSLTLIRFSAPEKKVQQAGVYTSSNTEGEEVTVSILQEELEKDIDGGFLSNFFSRYVASGKVTYMDKNVGTDQEVEDELLYMEGAYSLFIVGKSDHQLTNGMNCNPEFPELGRVGDLLASSEFSNHGSVLVVEQHK
ncbi:cation/H(+) antiporter 1-like [Aristolochia californica]|uniref:cation/H(+) antiporter 1-like n=1 Tax=Aristolochia californica TaxID=171875 RepID=UPI0035DF4E0C